MSTTSGPRKVAACTIVAHNYVPRASVLAESLEKFHPEIEMHTVIIDHPRIAREVTVGNSKVISINEVDLKENSFSRQASIYDITEFATSIKPFVLEQLLSEYEVVLYLDPDIQVFSRLDSLVENTFIHGWTVTPHVTAPYENRSAGPSEKEIMGAGIYNLGYIGVSRQSIPMLHWWQNRLNRHAIVDQANQLFTDQRWIDLAVSIFRPHVEVGTQFNVAYWNLDHREFGRNLHGEYTVDGTPLAFFHFSGFNPKTPYLMCRYQDEIPRVSMSDNPLFYEIFNQYCIKIKDSEEKFGVLPKYGWGEFSPGIVLERPVRRLLRLELMAAEKGLCAYPPNPFAADEVTNFFNWLHAPSPIDNRPIPRHALAKLLSLPHDDARLKDMHLPSVVVEYEKWFDGSLLPNEPLSRLIGNKFALHHEYRSFFSEAALLGEGIDVVGYVNSELGIGESARRVVGALREVGVPVSIAGVPTNADTQPLANGQARELSHSSVLLAVNADQVPQLAPYIPRRGKKRKLIGQWYWELERPPIWMANSFQFLDEVWVATEFMAQSVRSVAPKRFPVHVVPVPLEVQDYEEVTRNALGLDDRFTFGFVFDFLSVMKRKNPIGLVNAYMKAFSTEGTTRLVIKTINAHLRPMEREELLWSVRGREDITIVNETWDQVEVLSFLKHVDCYVSMHRSEGLGLTIAEAMSQGTPVIATGYSGNMDFTTSDNSYLIPMKLVKVGSDAENYDSEAEWAEPDFDMAVQLMQRVVNNRSEAIEVGLRGMKEINSQFSFTKVGEIIKARLTNKGGI